MTRKHFNRLAKIMAEHRPINVFGDVSPCIKVWEWILDDLVEFCQEENPRFDPVRFRDACRKEN